MADILSGVDIRDPKVTVNAIDLCDVEEELRAQDIARVLGERLRWNQLNLLDARELPEYGDFDVVQCGFVLHDIPWDLKDRAMMILLEALQPRGHLVISEIAARPDRNYVSEMSEIYDAFVAEAITSRESGSLNPDSWQLLVGDGVTPGLLRSKADAIEGGRDFFDTLPRLVERAENAGLRACNIIENGKNDRLAVTVFRRIDHSRQSEQQGNRHVH
jgi:hypothetical protein